MEGGGSVSFFVCLCLSLVGVCVGGYVDVSVCVSACVSVCVCACVRACACMCAFQCAWQCVCAVFIMCVLFGTVKSNIKKVQMLTF